ncbi:hypothetical protein THOB06_120129 [Vibrio rotiferianus]|nr:hypothetical protein THOG10_120131 [Vibrio rotiferianus]CAH1562712.1 hypothetical protein THOB06_120129 [Vibrio rotiferianus]
MQPLARDLWLNPNIHLFEAEQPFVAKRIRGIVITFCITTIPNQMNKETFVCRN